MRVTAKSMDEHFFRRSRALSFEVLSSETGDTAAREFIDDARNLSWKENRTIDLWDVADLELAEG